MIYNVWYQGKRIIRVLERDSENVTSTITKSLENYNSYYKTNIKIEKCEIIVENN